jgi:prepilin-type N-terminal cleavage/methylation domain-containing protein
LRNRQQLKGSSIPFRTFWLSPKEILYVNITPATNRSPSVAPTRGFTLVELLVVIAIIGVLIGLLLPAVQAARESGRRSVCITNMKQQGLAFHSFHDAKRAFPSAGAGTSKQPNWGHSQWVVLMPHLEMADLYDRWDFDVSEEGLTDNLSLYTTFSTVWPHVPTVGYRVLQCPSSAIGDSCDKPRSHDTSRIA